MMAYHLPKDRVKALKERPVDVESPLQLPVHGDLFRLASRSVAISTVFSRVRFSVVTHFLSLRRACRCWRRRTAVESHLRRMSRIRLFAVSPSCFDTRRKPITSVNTTDYSTSRELLASFVFSSYVQLLSGYRSDRQRFLYVPVKVFFLPIHAGC